MIGIPAEQNDDLYDKAADEEIARCVASDPPASFFLYAGAGSGKTRSLINALQEIELNVGPRLRLHGQKIGVITFTNKACEVIQKRLIYLVKNPELFSVSTIHSFSWSLICGFNYDIREWLRTNLITEIADLEEKERKGISGQASIDRKNKIAAKNERLQLLNRIKRFIYSPDGDNPERNALNHAEVIGITSSFLTDKSVMQSILVNRFPILLIDESQDTNKELMEALFFVQTNQKNRFALGVIGDTMQRIYPSGKVDIDSNLPDDWKKPIKIMNHRSCRRIIELINRIREPIDVQKQRPRSDKNEGFVRIFILPAESTNKNDQEHEIFRKMAVITSDVDWLEPDNKVKILILEHRMAANRLGFLPMWDILSSVNSLQTGLRNGKLPGLQFFSHLILPLIKAYQKRDRFTIASIVRKHSPLLEKTAIEACQGNQRSQIEKAKEALNTLASLWLDGYVPTFIEILNTVCKTGLFKIPEILRPYEKRIEESIAEDEDDNREDELIAWRRFLETSFDQLERYSQYVQGEAQYDTHQGVKGLEFQRVCVIMDDSEAKGRTFFYDKLFGAKEDSTRRESGQETSIDRTRRLFYVTCSRAENSLALIVYSSQPEQVREHVIKNDWFKENEVIMYQ